MYIKRSTQVSFFDFIPICAPLSWWWGMFPECPHSDWWALGCAAQDWSRTPLWAEPRFEYS